MGKEARSRAALQAVEKPEDPVTLPSQLTPSDLAYQQAMLTRIRREQAEHQGLLKCWTDFVSATYRLGPQDRIEESGRIVRVEADKKDGPA